MLSGFFVLIKQFEQFCTYDYEYEPSVTETINYRRMNKILLFLFMALFVGKSFSQTIILPIVNIKSHKTLTVEKIESSGEQTTIFLSVENQKTEGEAWFCADKNIYIKNARGTEMIYLLKSMEIQFRR